MDRGEGKERWKGQIRKRYEGEREKKVVLMKGEMEEVVDKETK